MLKKNLYFCILLLFLHACSSDNLSEITPKEVKTPLHVSDTVYYQPKIQNLIAVYCIDCHNVQNKKGNVNLDHFEDVKIHAEKSYQEMLSKKMPQGGATLDEETLNSMKRWIELGKPYGKAKVSYNQDVQPMIELECGSCHISTASGGVFLRNYDEVKSVAQDGRLLGTMTQNGYTLMPPDVQLPNNQINIINDWINANYPQ